MLHPSYTDLMRVVNSEIEEGEEKVVNSRYSIVLATSKRARQLIDHAEPKVDSVKCLKPLSIAIEELNNSKIKILSEDEEDEMEQFSDDWVVPDPLRSDCMELLVARKITTGSFLLLKVEKRDECDREDKTDYACQAFLGCFSVTDFGFATTFLCWKYYCGARRIDGDNPGEWSNCLN